MARKRLTPKEADELIGKKLYDYAERYGMTASGVAERDYCLEEAKIDPQTVTPGAVAAAHALERARTFELEKIEQEFNRRLRRYVWPVDYAPLAPLLTQWMAWAGWGVKRVRATLRGLGWAMDEDDLEWNMIAGQRAKAEPVALTDKDIALLEDAI